MCGCNSCIEDEALRALEYTNKPASGFVLAEDYCCWARCCSRRLLGSELLGSVATLIGCELGETSEKDKR